MKGNGDTTTVAVPRNRVAERLDEAEALLDEVRAMLAGGDTGPPPKEAGLPGYREGGVSRLIQSMILGGYAPEEIEAAIRARFPQAKADRRRVYWHTSLLRRQGLIPEASAH